MVKSAKVEDKEVNGEVNDNRNRSAQCGFRVSGPIDKPNGLPGKGREIERKCGYLLVQWSGKMGPASRKSHAVRSNVLGLPVEV